MGLTCCPVSESPSRALRLMAAVALVATSGLVAATCPPVDVSRAALERLVADSFRIDDPGERQALAIGLLDCVGHPDPFLRDGVAFTGLSRWLREKALAPATAQTLRRELVDQVRSPADAAGVRQPFAVLILSEVVRADRIDPMLTPAQRSELVDLAVAYMRGIDDYRGYVDGEGWRHGVAHGADLVLQLVVNPAIGAVDVERLMDALAAQIAPAGVAYTQGESERLARTVFFAHRRGELPARFWTTWFARLSDPVPLESWEGAFESEAGLARRHDVVAFLLHLGFAASTAHDAMGGELASRANAALRRVMGE
jgi:hypothetical protein